MVDADVTFGLPDPLVDDAIEGVIGLVYDASLDTEKWRDVAHRLSDYLGGHTVSVRMQMPEPISRSEVYRSDDLSIPNTVFDQQWKHGLPWGNEAPSDEMAARYRTHFVDNSPLFPNSELSGTGFYREWMAPRGLAPRAPYVHVFAMDGRRPLAAVTLYSRIGLPEVTSAQLAELDRLVPHLAQAHTILDSVRSTGHWLATFKDLVDRLPTGLILVDENGRVSDMNEAAHLAMEAGSGLAVVDGRLVAESPDDDRWLHDVIERVSNPRACERVDPEHGFEAHRSAREGSMPVIVSPIPVAASDSSAPDTTAVVFLGNPQLAQGTATRMMRGLYALTRAEADLTWLLADGLTLEQAAEERSVTLNTARSQLKRVFTKTGAKKQSDLVRLVLGGVAAVRGES